MVCDENYVDRGMDDVRKFWKLKVWWINYELDVWEEREKKNNNNFNLSHFSFHDR